MGNYHARFLGGNGAARLLTYPIFKNSNHENLILDTLEGNTYNKREPYTSSFVREVT